MERSRVVVMFHLLALIGVSPVLATNCWSLEGDHPVTVGLGGTSLFHDDGGAALMNNRTTLALMVPGPRLDLPLPRLDASVAAATSTPRSHIEAGLSAKAFHKPAFGRSGKPEGGSCEFDLFSPGDRGAIFGPASWLTPLGQTSWMTAFDQIPWMSAPVQGLSALLTPDLRTRPDIRVGRLPEPMGTAVSDRLRVGAPINVVWTWPLSAVESPPFGE